MFDLIVKTQVGLACPTIWKDTSARTSLLTKDEDLANNLSNASSDCLSSLLLGTPLLMRENGPRSKDPCIIHSKTPMTVLSPSKTSSGFPSKITSQLTDRPTSRNLDHPTLRPNFENEASARQVQHPVTHPCER